MTSIDELPGYAVILGVIAIVAGLCSKILSSMRASETDATVNTTLTQGITAISTLTDWLDEIALVIAAVVILGLIMGMLVLVQTYRGRGGSGGGL